MSKEEAIREAEAFVRKAIARVSKSPVSERTIKLAAAKVAKVAPSQTDKSKGKAA